MLLLLSAAHVGEVNHSAEQACSVTDFERTRYFQDLRRSHPPLRRNRDGPGLWTQRTWDSIALGVTGVASGLRVLLYC